MGLWGRITREFLTEWSIKENGVEGQHIKKMENYRPPRSPISVKRVRNI